MDIDLFDEIRKDVQKMIQNDNIADRKDIASVILTNLDYLQYRVTDCEAERAIYEMKFVKERLAHKSRYDGVEK